MASNVKQNFSDLFPSSQFLCIDQYRSFETRTFTQNFRGHPRAKLRYPVNSPTVQLANANSPTYKIEQKCQRVGLQSSTTYQKLNIQKSERSLGKKHFFSFNKVYKDLMANKVRQISPMTEKASDANEILCDNNTLKSYHVNRSDFLKETWLSGQNLQ